MKLSGYDFTPRSGPVAYAMDYDAAGCKQMSGNRIRLTITKDLQTGMWRSAGMLGPVLGYGLYEIEVSGRIDTLDPALVAAAWLYNDANRDEVDFFEASRWGDLNQPNSLQLTALKAGIKIALQDDREPGLTRCGARAFRRFKFTGNVTPLGVDLQAFGQKPDGGWMLIGNRSLGASGDYGQVRLGLWLPKSGFAFEGDAVARGPMYVTFDALRFTPAK